MNRRNYLALATAGITAGIAGCGGSTDEPEPADDSSGENDNSEDTSESNTDDSTDNGVESEPESVTASIGEHVEGDDISLVVEDFERGVSFGEFTDPDPGNEFAVASIALKNTSSDYTSVSNLLQTRLRDDEDYQYDQTFLGGSTATFNDGQFAPGELERGGIPFEIPEDSSGLELIFDLDSSIFGGLNRATIDLESTSESAHELTQDLGIDVYGVGDTVSYGDVEIAVNDVREEDSLGSFVEPDSGNEYVVVDISITNDTGEEKSFSTILQMMAKDENGYTYQEDLMATTGLDRAFDEGTPLSDGETRRGELVYEVEEGLSPLYWVFEFEVFATGDKTFWQLR